MTNATVMWEWLDRPGHEAARLVEAGSGHTLEGSAVFMHEGQPCRLNYRVECDPDWRTVRAEVNGSVGDQVVGHTLTRDRDGGWQMDGVTRPEVQGCIDIDLNFSPSTNLLPIRRLELARGEESVVRAAWLRFPSFDLEPLEQLYRRTSETSYRYESGRFAAELQVGPHGLVLEYAGVWKALT